MKIKIKIASSKLRDEAFIVKEDGPVLKAWNTMSEDQKLATYFKFEFMVCWRCGKKTENARLYGVKIDGELKGLFICQECKWWMQLQKTTEEKENQTVKIKLGGEKVKKEKNKKGLVPFEPTKGKSGLGVRSTMIYGLHKGLRDKKLVAFMEKEYPERKTKWEGQVASRERKFEKGKYKDEVKAILKDMK